MTTRTVSIYAVSEGSSPSLGTITFRTIALGLLLLASPAALRAGFVTNGDFEDVLIGSPFFSNNPANIPGWTHTGASGDALLWAVGYSEGGGNAITVAGHGVQFVTLGGGGGGSGTGSWEQTLTGLTAGASYGLTFDMASEEPGAGAQSITVDFPTGSSTVPATFTAAASSGNYWRDWEEKTMTFVASGSSATLRFSATTQFDVGLDYVRVSPSAVPEPSSLALASIGLGLGYWWHRRCRACQLKSGKGDKSN